MNIATTITDFIVDRTRRFADRKLREQNEHLGRRLALAEKRIQRLDEITAALLRATPALKAMMPEAKR